MTYQPCQHIQFYLEDKGKKSSGIGHKATHIREYTCKNCGHKWIECVESERGELEKLKDALLL
jgi:hypothetical protein